MPLAVSLPSQLAFERRSVTVHWHKKNTGYDQELVDLVVVISHASGSVPSIFTPPGEHQPDSEQGWPPLNEVPGSLFNL